jgi:HD-like signal output (HDOD) protein
MLTQSLDKKEFLRTRIQEMDSLPSVASIVRPLLHYLEDPGDQIEVPKVVELVSCDNSITAQCLRMANSPLFGRSREVDTVRGAVVALGMRRLREILLSCVLVRLTPKGNQTLNAALYWQHSLGCALVSRQLAKKINFHAAEKAYLAGLLHDVGIVVTSCLMPEDFGRAMQLAAAEQISEQEAERATFGFTHSFAGEVLATHWRLPEAVRQVILYHHDVEQAKLHVSLVAIVSLADSFCRMRGLDNGFGNAPDIPLWENPAWLTLSKEYPYLQEFDLESFMVELDEFVGVAREMVASIFH